MVNAFRYGMLGVSDIDIRVAYGITLTFIAILFGVSMFMMDRGIGIRE